MNDPKAPKKFSDLSPDEKIDILLQEREMNQGGDPGLLEQINIELTMAFEEKDFQEQYFNENFIQEMSFATSPKNKDIVNQEEESKPVEVSNSENSAVSQQTVKKIDEIHKAFLGSIKPKEQNNNEIIEQMKARKLAQGAIKIRKGK